MPTDEQKEQREILEFAALAAGMKLEDISPQQAEEVLRAYFSNQQRGLSPSRAMQLASDLLRPLPLGQLKDTETVSAIKDSVAASVGKNVSDAGLKITEMLGGPGPTASEKMTDFLYQAEQSGRGIANMWGDGTGMTPVGKHIFDHGERGQPISTHIAEATAGFAWGFADTASFGLIGLIAKQLEHGMLQGAPLLGGANVYPDWLENPTTLSGTIGKQLGNFAGFLVGPGKIVRAPRMLMAKAKMASNVGKVTRAAMKSKGGLKAALKLGADKIGREGTAKLFKMYPRKTAVELIRKEGAPTLKLILQKGIRAGHGTMQEAGTRAHQILSPAVEKFVAAGKMGSAIKTGKLGKDLPLQSPAVQKALAEIGNSFGKSEATFWTKVMGISDDAAQSTMKRISPEIFDTMSQETFNTVRAVVKDAVLTGGVPRMTLGSFGTPAMSRALYSMQHSIEVAAGLSMWEGLKTGIVQPAADAGTLRELGSGIKTGLYAWVPLEPEWKNKLSPVEQQQVKHVRKALFGAMQAGAILGLVGGIPNIGAFTKLKTATGDTTVFKEWNRVGKTLDDIRGAQGGRNIVGGRGGPVWVKPGAMMMKGKGLQEYIIGHMKNMARKIAGKPYEKLDKNLFKLPYLNWRKWARKDSEGFKEYLYTIRDALVHPKAYESTRSGWLADGRLDILMKDNWSGKELQEAARALEFLRSQISTDLWRVAGREGVQRIIAALPRMAIGAMAMNHDMFFSAGDDQKPGRTIWSKDPGMALYSVLTSAYIAYGASYQGDYRMNGGVIPTMTTERFRIAEMRSMLQLLGNRVPGAKIDAQYTVVNKIGMARAHASKGYGHKLSMSEGAARAPQRMMNEVEKIIRDIDSGKRNTKVNAARKAKQLEGVNKHLLYTFVKTLDEMDYRPKGVGESFDKKGKPIILRDRPFDINTWSKIDKAEVLDVLLNAQDSRSRTLDIEWYGANLRAGRRDHATRVMKGRIRMVLETSKKLPFRKGQVEKIGLKAADEARNTPELQQKIDQFNAIVDEMVYVRVPGVLKDFEGKPHVNNTIPIAQIEAALKRPYSVYNMAVLASTDGAAGPDQNYTDWTRNLISNNTWEHHAEAVTRNKLGNYKTYALTRSMVSPTGEKVDKVTITDFVDWFKRAGAIDENKNQYIMPYVPRDGNSKAVSNKLHQDDLTAIAGMLSLMEFAGLVGPTNNKLLPATTEEGRIEPETAQMFRQMAAIAEDFGFWLHKDEVVNVARILIADGGHRLTTVDFQTAMALSKEGLVDISQRIAYVPQAYELVTDPDTGIERRELVGEELPGMRQVMRVYNRLYNAGWLKEIRQLDPTKLLKYETRIERDRLEEILQNVEDIDRNDEVGWELREKMTDLIIRQETYSGTKDVLPEHILNIMRTLVNTGGTQVMGRVAELFERVKVTTRDKNNELIINADRLFQKEVSYAFEALAGAHTLDYSESPDLAEHLHSLSERAERNIKGLTDPSKKYSTPTVSEVRQKMKMGMGDYIELSYEVRAGRIKTVEQLRLWALNVGIPSKNINAVETSDYQRMISLISGNKNVAEVTLGLQYAQVETDTDDPFVVTQVDGVVKDMGIDGRSSLVKQVEEYGFELEVINNTMMTNDGRQVDISSPEGVDMLKRYASGKLVVAGSGLSVEEPAGVARKRLKRRQTIVISAGRGRILGLQVPDIGTAEGQKQWKTNVKKLAETYDRYGHLFPKEDLIHTDGEKLTALRDASTLPDVKDIKFLLYGLDQSLDESSLSVLTWLDIMGQHLGRSMIEALEPPPADRPSERFEEAAEQFRKRIHTVISNVLTSPRVAAELIADETLDKMNKDSRYPGEMSRDIDGDVALKVTIVEGIKFDGEMPVAGIVTGMTGVIMGHRKDVCGDLPPILKNTFFVPGEHEKDEGILTKHSMQRNQKQVEPWLLANGVVALMTKGKAVKLLGPNVPFNHVDDYGGEESFLGSIKAKSKLRDLKTVTVKLKHLYSQHIPSGWDEKPVRGLAFAMSIADPALREWAGELLDLQSPTVRETAVMYAILGSGINSSDETNDMFINAMFRKLMAESMDSEQSESVSEFVRMLKADHKWNPMRTSWANMAMQTFTSRNLKEPLFTPKDKNASGGTLGSDWFEDLRGEDEVGAMETYAPYGAKEIFIGNPITKRGSAAIEGADGQYEAYSLMETDNWNNNFFTNLAKRAGEKGRTVPELPVWLFPHGMTPATMKKVNADIAKNPEMGYFYWGQAMYRCFSGENQTFTSLHSGGYEPYTFGVYQQVTDWFEGLLGGQEPVDEVYHLEPTLRVVKHGIANLSRRNPVAFSADLINGVTVDTNLQGEGNVIRWPFNSQAPVNADTDGDNAAEFYAITPNHWNRAAHIHKGAGAIQAEASKVDSKYRPERRPYKPRSLEDNAEFRRGYNSSRIRIGQIANHGQSMTAISNKGITARLKEPGPNGRPFRLEPIVNYDQKNTPQGSDDKADEQLGRGIEKHRAGLVQASADVGGLYPASTFDNQGWLDDLVAGGWKKVYLDELGGEEELTASHQNEMKFVRALMDVFAGINKVTNPNYTTDGKESRNYKDIVELVNEYFRLSGYNSRGKYTNKLALAKTIIRSRFLTRGADDKEDIEFLDFIRASIGYGKDKELTFEDVVSALANLIDIARPDNLMPQEKLAVAIKEVDNSFRRAAYQTVDDGDIDAVERTSNSYGMSVGEPELTPKAMGEIAREVSTGGQKAVQLSMDKMRDRISHLYKAAKTEPNKRVRASMLREAKLLGESWGEKQDQFENAKHRDAINSGKVFMGVVKKGEIASPYEVEGESVALNRGTEYLAIDAVQQHFAALVPGGDQGNTLIGNLTTEVNELMGYIKSAQYAFYTGNRFRVRGHSLDKNSVDFASRGARLTEELLKQIETKAINEYLAKYSDNAEWEDVYELALITLVKPRAKDMVAIFRFHTGHTIPIYKPPYYKALGDRPNWMSRVDPSAPDPHAGIREMISLFQQMFKNGATEDDIIRIKTWGQRKITPVAPNWRYATHLQGILEEEMLGMPTGTDEFGNVIMHEPSELAMRENSAQMRYMTLETVNGMIDDIPQSNIVVLSLGNKQAVCTYATFARKVASVPQQSEHIVKILQQSREDGYLILDTASQEIRELFSPIVVRMGRRRLGGPRWDRWKSRMGAHLLLTNSEGAPLYARQMGFWERRIAKARERGDDILVKRLLGDSDKASRRLKKLLGEVTNNPQLNAFLPGLFSVGAWMTSVLGYDPHGEEAGPMTNDDITKLTVEWSKMKEMLKDNQWNNKIKAWVYPTHHFLRKHPVTREFMVDAFFYSQQLLSGQDQINNAVSIIRDRIVDVYNQHGAKFLDRKFGEMKLRKLEKQLEKAAALASSEKQSDITAVANRIKDLKKQLDNLSQTDPIAHINKIAVFILEGVDVFHPDQKINTWQKNARGNASRDMMHQYPELRNVITHALDHLHKSKIRLESGFKFFQQNTLHSLRARLKGPGGRALTKVEEDMLAKLETKFSSLKNIIGYFPHYHYGILSGLNNLFNEVGDVVPTSNGESFLDNLNTRVDNFLNKNLRHREWVGDYSIDLTRSLQRYAENALTFEYRNRVEHRVGIVIEKLVTSMRDPDFDNVQFGASVQQLVTYMEKWRSDVLLSKERGSFSTSLRVLRSMLTFAKIGYNPLTPLRNFPQKYYTYAMFGYNRIKRARQMLRSGDTELIAALDANQPIGGLSAQETMRMKTALARMGETEAKFLGRLNREVERSLILLKKFPIVGEETIRRETFVTGFVDLWEGLSSNRSLGHMFKARKFTKDFQDYYIDAVGGWAEIKKDKFGNDPWLGIDKDGVPLPGVTPEWVKKHKEYLYHQAARRATEMVAMIQYDYSQGARPPWMRNPFGALMGHLKSYDIFNLSMMGTVLNDAKHRWNGRDTENYKWGLNDFRKSNEAATIARMGGFWIALNAISAMVPIGIMRMFQPGAFEFVGNLKAWLTGTDTEKERAFFGRGPVQSMTGPVIGEATEIINLLARDFIGDPSDLAMLAGFRDFRNLPRNVVRHKLMDNVNSEAARIVRDYEALTMEATAGYQRPGVYFAIAGGHLGFRGSHPERESARDTWRDVTGWRAPISPSATSSRVTPNIGAIVDAARKRQAALMLDKLKGRK